MNRNAFYCVSFFLAFAVSCRAQKATTARSNFIELDATTSEQYLKLYDELLIKFVNSPEVPSTVITYEPGGFENGANRLTVIKNRRYYYSLSGDATLNNSVLICEKQKKKGQFPLVRVTFLYDYNKEKGYIECSKFKGNGKKKITTDPALAVMRLNDLLIHD